MKVPLFIEAALTNKQPLQLPNQCGKYINLTNLGFMFYVLLELGFVKLLADMIEALVLNPVLMFAGSALVKYEYH